MEMEKRGLKYCSSPQLLIFLAIFLLVPIIAGRAKDPTHLAAISEEEANDGDQCKDVIQDSPEFGYCLKSISQKWPTEVALLPCCRQFKKMDENCRCEAVKHIVDAALAAAAGGSLAGQGDRGGISGALSGLREDAK